MQKNNKGITLIALVVTIIVMIILASITITALTGKKSTINQTTDTTESAQRESIIEKIEADLLQEKMKTGNMLPALRSGCSSPLEELRKLKFWKGRIIS